MEYRRFDINLRQADGFNCTNLFFKTSVYGTVSVVGGSSPSSQRTSVGKYKGKNVTWDSRSSMRFYVEDSKLEKNHSVVMIQLWCKRIVGGDDVIGQVCVPLKQLFDNCGGINTTNYGCHQVIRTSSRKRRRQGFLYFTFQFGETIKASLPVNEVDNGLMVSRLHVHAPPSAPTLDYLGLDH